MKIIGGVIAILSLFGILFGVHEWQENRYAFKEALAQTDKKVDYHIANQQRETLEYRLEKKKEEYKKNPTQDKKELIDDLEKRLKEKEEDLRKLEKK